MWSDANFGLHHTHSFNLSTLQIVFIVFVSICLLGSIKEHLVFSSLNRFHCYRYRCCARSSTHLIVDCIVSHSDPQSILPVISKVTPTLLETCHSLQALVGVPKSHALLQPYATTTQAHAALVL